MGHTVPFFEFGRVFKPEIGSEIDDFDASVQQFFCMRHGDAMRRGEENDVAFFQVRFFGGDKSQVDDPAQGREHIGYFGAVVASGGNGG